MSKTGPMGHLLGRGAAESEAPGRLRGNLVRAVSAVVSALLTLFIAKNIAIFVWWLSNRANRIDFRDRVSLRRRVEAATREGRPVLFASNHVSMFDDPVLPMALYRMGARAIREWLVLATLLLLYWTVPATLLPPAVLGIAVLGWAAGIAFFGARKVWWSLGDLVNFSGATALRGKLEIGRKRPLSRTRLALLRATDRAIFHFMRSGTVKTVFVDRRAGEEAKRARARAVTLTIDIAARAEPIWIFFEGNRERIPGEIGPARRGIGDIIVGLRRRGLDPLVVGVRQRGLEHVLPRGSKRFITSGHLIEVCWCECQVDAAGPTGGPESDPQAVADAVREQVAALQPGEPRRGEGPGGEDGAGRSA
ncbi:MAG: hypothetical protein GY723_10735 [bacterium]|nr:hypothetical protein [bacterium]